MRSGIFAISVVLVAGCNSYSTGDTAGEDAATDGVVDDTTTVADSGGDTGVVTDSGTKPDTAVPDTASPACNPAPAAGDDCTLFPSCGCAAGNSCLPASGHMKCLPAGSGARNSRCSGDADCGLGMECAYGLCAPRCKDGAPGGSCTGVCLMSGTNPYGYCTPGCNPLQPTSCQEGGSSGIPGSGTGQACTALKVNGTTAFGCIRAGTGTSGASCAGGGPCGAGFICASVDAACHQLCGGTTTCPSGKQCILETNWFYGSTAVGTCTL